MAVLVQVFYTVTSVSANYVIAQFYTELWLAYLPLPCALSTDSSLPVVKVAKPRSRRSRLVGRVAGMTLFTFSRLILFLVVSFIFGSVGRFHQPGVNK